MEDAEIVYNPEDDETSKIQAAFEESYLDKEGVIGVGLGADPKGDDALVVYISHDGVAKALPRAFMGLPVITETVGDIVAY